MPIGGSESSDCVGETAGSARSVQSLKSNNNARPDSATSSQKSKAKKPKKLPVKETPHCVLWIPVVYKGRGTKVKVMGVYPTHAKAMEKKQEIMGQYDNCGKGDILVGPTIYDEIDLVVKPCELHLDN
eukprot:Nk52_evm46s2579 gene=Nk52_evmTU46s2579